MNAAGNKEKPFKDRNDAMIIIPDDWIEEDLIGYQTFGEAIRQLINSIRSRGSFSIGIFGEWGQGKTSLLKQIQKSFDQQYKTTDAAILTVWFNPWLYSGEPHFIAPLLNTLLATFDDYLEGSNKEKNIITGLSTRIKTFSSKIRDLTTSMSRFMHTPGTPLGTKWELAQKSPTDYHNQIEALGPAAVELNARVVVFIDDLDRCPPLAALELLENLRIFLDIYGFTFVVSMSRDSFKQAIHLRYRDLYHSTPTKTFMEQEYLEKLIQFSINLPAIEAKLFRDYVANRLLKTSPQYHQFLDTILAVLEHNPRQIKRFFNAVTFCNWVAKHSHQMNMEIMRLELTIKISLIAFQFPELYSQLCHHPHHLLHLQNIIWMLDEDNSTQKQLRGEKKTKIQEIDRWLEEPYLSKISSILKKGKRSHENSSIEDQGFKNREDVEQYVRLLALVVPANFSAPTLTENVDASLKHITEGRMKRIKDGNFLMGDWESSQFNVTLESYLLDMYPVTQSLYQQVMGKNPSRFSGVDQPVESVSWFDAILFCNRLSEKTGLKPVYNIEGDLVTWDRNAIGFRLPTEAEWEYACRAGSEEDRYGKLDDIGWYEANSKGTPHGVGQKVPNEFGLFDMIGNVWEWVWDWFDDYPAEPAINPSGPASGSFRVVRGGSWFNVAHVCRSAVRDGSGPAYVDGYLGFRIARSCPPGESK